MGRWQPDAQGRLQKAAMELYAERGYEATTIAEIAERAGLTKRTFFRYFADKREVLFFGSAVFEQRFVEGVSGAPPDAGAMDAVAAGLHAVSGPLDADGLNEFVTLRAQIIAATPELQERELGKLAAVAASVSRALEQRGVEPLQAKLAAESGIAVCKVAFPRWTAPGNKRSLTELMSQSVSELQALRVS